MALRDPEYRTLADEIFDTFDHGTVRRVKVQGPTAYLEFADESGERSYIAVDAASVSDARSVWPHLA
jgi:hypothetical protein